MTLLTTSDPGGTVYVLNAAFVPLWRHGACTILGRLRKQSALFLDVTHMRVALFFDGKNFYSGWKDQTGARTIDFEQLSRWIVRRVGGSFLWGAYYYTGIEPESGAVPNRLVAFLNMLELRPGFFVHRFPRKTRSTHCESCGAENHYTAEKEVDTTMVADMLRLAAVGAFDIVVLMSGDADHAPAVEGVRLLGKQAYVATWGGSGLSARLRKAAFDHIDLLSGLPAFEVRVAEDAQLPLASSSTATELGAKAPSSATELPLEGTGDDPVADVFLAELTVAEQRFSTGYVGINYFITKWRSQKLDPSPIVRRRLLNRLTEAKEVELYVAPNGEKAMRRRR
jgi:uncharacterized LabA/DUF88 family protein